MYGAQEDKVLVIGHVNDEMKDEFLNVNTYNSRTLSRVGRLKSICKIKLTLIPAKKL